MFFETISTAWHENAHDIFRRLPRPEADIALPSPRRCTTLSLISATTTASAALQERLLRDTSDMPMPRAQSYFRMHGMMESEQVRLEKILRLLRIAARYGGAVTLGAVLGVARARDGRVRQEYGRHLPQAGMRSPSRVIPVRPPVTR